MIGKVSLRFSPNQQANSYLRLGFWSEKYICVKNKNLKSPIVVVGILDDLVILCIAKLNNKGY